MPKSRSTTRNQGADGMPRISTYEETCKSNMKPVELKVERTESCDYKSDFYKHKKSHAPMKRAPSKKKIMIKRQQSLTKENCGTIATLDKHRRQSLALTTVKNKVMFGEQ